MSSAPQALKPGSDAAAMAAQQQQQATAQAQQQAAAAAQLQAQQRSSLTTGLRYPSNRKTIYDRNLGRSKNAELSRAAFAYLFVEMIAYAQRRVTGIADLEKRWVDDSSSPPRKWIRIEPCLRGKPVLRD